jgi:5'(3')-deoxyribonucleotidase
MLRDSRYEAASHGDVRHIIAHMHEQEESQNSAGVRLSNVIRVHRVKKVDPQRADPVASRRKLREVWLSVVDSVYWEMVHEGTIDRRGRLARLLLQSCDAARQNISVELSDWSALKRILHSRSVNAISHLEHYIGFVTSTHQRCRRYDGKVMERNIGAALTFQHAHAVARERVANYLGVSATYQSHATDESGVIWLTLPHPFQDDSAVVFCGRSSILMVQTTYFVRIDPHNSSAFTLHTKTGRLVNFSSEHDVEFGTFDVCTDGDDVEAQLAEHFLTVREESDDQVAEAEKFLTGVDQDLKVQCQNRRLAKLILHKQMELAESLVDQGIIGWDDKELVMCKIREDAAQLVDENLSQKPTRV